jgi:hypothetical protein
MNFRLRTSSGPSRDRTRSLSDSAVEGKEIDLLIAERFFKSNERLITSCETLVKTIEKTIAHLQKFNWDPQGR